MNAAPSLVQSILGVTSNLVFVILLLLHRDGCWRLPGEAVELPWRPTAVVSALESFARGTRQYMIVSTVFRFIVAALDTIFLPHASAGPAAVGTSPSSPTIPNVGFLIGVAPPTLLGLLEGGPGLMVLIIVVYVVLNFIIQSLINRSLSETRSPHLSSRNPTPP